MFFSLIILILLSLPLLVVLTRLILKQYAIKSQTAFVVVLGDIGRSPRMNYHSLSLAKNNYYVRMIGYTDSKQMNEIESNNNINVSALNSFPKSLQLGPQLIQYIMKALFLTLNLLFVLIKTRPLPKFVLVQNPPSIPTLAVVYFYTLLTGSKFVIDWHNYGFTILALKNGPNNILVKLCKRFALNINIY